MIDTQYNTYTFKSGSHEKEKYKFFYYTCDNPVCKCTELDLIFHEFDEDIEDYEEVQSDYEITVDILAKTLGSFEDERQADTNFGKAFIDDLDADDWSRLADIFLNSKAEMIENGDMSEVEYDFPEDVILGDRIPYQTIFKFGRIYSIDIENRHLTLADYQCINPKCTCTEVVVSFMSETQTKDIIEYGREFISGHVDYKKKTWTASNQIGLEGLDFNQCMKKILSIVPNYFEILKKRERQLKELYQYNQETTEEFQPIIETIVNTSPSIGRNDPCPCGSGKKYKKCCG